MKKILLSFVFVISITNVFAAYRYWVGGNGDWTDTNHWSETTGGAKGAAIPVATDYVYFDASSGNPTINVDGLTINVTLIELKASSAQTVILNGTASISVTSATALTVNTGCTLNHGTSTITVAGTVGSTGTLISSGSGKVIMTAAGKNLTPAKIGNFEIAGGTSASPINLSTSTTLQSGCTFTVASNGYLKSAAKTLTALAGCTIVINGGVSINQSSGLYAVSSALIPTTNSPTITLGSASTIEYNNTTAQNIQALNYANLKISGARAANNVVLPSSTIGISGTLDLTGLTFTTGIISVNANSTIDFNNPTGGQTIPALKTWPYKNLIVSNTSGTQTLAEAITVGGTLTTSAGGTLATASTLTTNGAVTMNGAFQLNLGGSATGTGAWAYNGASGSLVYNTGGTTTSTDIEWPTSTSPANVTVQNATSVNLNNPKTINGTLTLSSGSLNNTTNGLTLGDGATVITNAGSLTAAPTFSSSVNLTYNGTSAQTPGNEFPASDIINTLTINNTHVNGFSLDRNKAVGSLSIGAGGILNVNAGKQLSVGSTMANGGTLNLLSTSADGTATILTPASISGSGTTNVSQYLGTARNWYVSSPLTNAKAPAGYTYYMRDETGSNASPVAPATAYWVSVASGNAFTPGTGYIALPGATGATMTFATETGGSLNSGNVSVPLTWAGVAFKGFNLIGNPYPSHLTWTKAFVDDATNAALIEPSIYYRTNAGSVNSGGDAAWSYKTYNSTSGVGTLGANAVIPPMQAFWVKSKAAGTLILDSKLTRSHQASNPLRAAVATKNADRPLVRLVVTNGTSTPDEAVLYSDANASNGVDRYDSPKMTISTNSMPEIYTLAGSEPLAINGLNSISGNMELPLGFKTDQSNTFSIKASEITNLEMGAKLILKDNVFGTEQDLTDGSAYSFTSDIAATDTRFTLLFKSAGGITGMDNSKEIPSVLVYKNANNQISVNCNGSINSNATVKVYSIYGQELYAQKITSTNTVLGSVFTSGVYLVKVNNGATSTTQKVMINQ